MIEQPPSYDVSELSLEEVVLLLATDEEKTKTDYSQTSRQVLEKFAA